MTRAWLLVVLAMAACFDPTPINPTCGPRSECPVGMICADGPGSVCKVEDSTCATVRDTTYKSCLTRFSTPSDPVEVRRIERHCWIEDATFLFDLCCDNDRDDSCGPPRPVCTPRVPVMSAAPDAARTAQFVAFGNRGGGWTGGDGVYSTRLPDGRLLWTFSDTFLGAVEADGSRSMSSPIINSAFVIEDGGELSTVNQASLVPAETSPRRWYWVGDSFVDGATLRAVFQRFVSTGAGQWEFRLDGNVLVEFALDDLTRPPVITPLPSEEGIVWGSAILPASEAGDGYTYVYGADDDHTSGVITRSMVVARVEGTDLRAPWRFLTSRGGWSPSERDAARVLRGVSNAVSVVPLRGELLVVTQDSSEPFSNRIMAAPACSPSGPFGSAIEVYRTPESGPFGTYRSEKIYTYNARAHAELSQGTTFTLSYNVNSFELADLYRDVTIYRPRFVTLTVE